MKAKLVKDLSHSALTPPQYVIQSFAMVGCTYFNFDSCEIVIWPELMYGSFKTVYGVLYFYVRFWDGRKLLFDVIEDRFAPYDGGIDFLTMKPLVAYCLGYMKIGRFDSNNRQIDMFRTF